jgi:hypothetical protein
MIALIWAASTTTDRSLRQLVVDHYATKVPIPVIEQHFRQYHPDFVQELMQKIIEIHQSTEANETAPQVNGNDHHAHQTTETNPATPQVNGDHHHANQNAESDDPTPQVNADHHHKGAPNQPRPIDPAAQRANSPASPGTATIILKDRLGNILHAQSALFFTPDRFVGAILPKLQGQTTGDEQTSVELELQFPNNDSQEVDRSEWSKSFGQVSTCQVLACEQ